MEFQKKKQLEKVTVSINGTYKNERTPIKHSKAANAVKWLGNLRFKDV